MFLECKEIIILSTVESSMMSSSIAGSGLVLGIKIFNITITNQNSPKPNWIQAGTDPDVAIDYLALDVAASSS